MKVACGIGLLLVLAAPAAAHVSLAAGPHGNPGAWFGPDSYPPAAIRREAQGRTVAQLTIDANGKVTGCTVAISSGDADLDAGTCNIALSRGRFTPARDTLGQPVVSTYRLPVRWVLPADPGPVAPAAASERPRHSGPLGWLARLGEAHHLIGLTGVLIAFLGARVRRLINGGSFAADGRELWDDDPFLAPRPKRWRSGLTGRVWRMATVVGPIIAVAVALAWIGW